MEKLCIFNDLGDKRVNNDLNNEVGQLSQEWLNQLHYLWCEILDETSDQIGNLNAIIEYKEIVSRTIVGNFKIRVRNVRVVASEPIASEIVGRLNSCSPIVDLLL